MGPLCIRGDGLDREYGNPNYSGVPRGSCPDLKATSAPTVRQLGNPHLLLAPQAILRSSCCAPQPFRATPRGRLRLRRKGG